MKKLFLLLMFPLLMITSCKDNAEKANNSNNATETVSKEMLLEQEIKAFNEQLPIQVDEATTLLSMFKDTSRFPK